MTELIEGMIDHGHEDFPYEEIFDRVDGSGPDLSDKDARIKASAEMLAGIFRVLCDGPANLERTGLKCVALGHLLDCLPKTHSTLQACAEFYGVSKQRLNQNVVYLRDRLPCGQNPRLHSESARLNASAAMAESHRRRRLEKKAPPDCSGEGDERNDDESQQCAGVNPDRRVPADEGGPRFEAMRRHVDAECESGGEA